MYEPGAYEDVPQYIFSAALESCAVTWEIGPQGDVHFDSATRSTVFMDGWDFSQAWVAAGAIYELCDLLDVDIDRLYSRIREHEN